MFSKSDPSSDQLLLSTALPEKSPLRWLWWVLSDRWTFHCPSQLCSCISGQTQLYRASCCNHQVCFLWAAWTNGKHCSHVGRIKHCQIWPAGWSSTRTGQECTWWKLDKQGCEKQVDSHYISRWFFVNQAASFVAALQCQLGPFLILSLSSILFVRSLEYNLPYDNIACPEISVMEQATIKSSSDR